jgi:hypothetical protein
MQDSGKLSLKAEIPSLPSGKPRHLQVDLAQWLWKPEALAASQGDFDGSS